MDDKRSIQNIRQNIRAITFDLWGTLIDDGFDPGFNPTFRQMRIHYFQKKLQEAGCCISDSIARSAYQHARDTLEELWKQQKPLRAEIGIKAMLEFVSATVSEKTQKDLVRYFEEVVNTATLRLYPGVVPLLRRLRAKYRLGLISDTGWTPGRVLREQLRRNNILSEFDILIFSDEAGFTKPHPKIFRMALHSLQVSAHSCLHVGDLPFTDIKGAKASGCYTAWIYKPEYAQNLEPDCQPDLILKSVSDLEPLLL